LFYSPCFLFDIENKGNNFLERNEIKEKKEKYNRMPGAKHIIIECEKKAVAHPGMWRSFFFGPPPQKNIPPCRRQEGMFSYIFSFVSN
jgi:hypothetical protein